MRNILLSMFAPKKAWSAPLEPYLSGKKVLILAFSFAAEFIRNPEDWVHAYRKPDGTYYLALVDAFKTYGVAEDAIHFGNYFEETTAKLQAEIKQAEVLFLPGGAPDEFYDRLKEKGLVETIQQFSGTIIGFSAGAMVQIQEFHITEDEHYATYSYHEGLDLIKDFDIEVHFEKEDPVMLASIQRCLAEKRDCLRDRQ